MLTRSVICVDGSSDGSVYVRKMCSCRYEFCSTGSPPFPHRYRVLISQRCTLTTDREHHLETPHTPVRAAPPPPFQGWSVASRLEVLTAQSQGAEFGSPALGIHACPPVQSGAERRWFLGLANFQPAYKSVYTPCLHTGT